MDRPPGYNPIEFHIRNIRTHEWAQRQSVSLLDIFGLSLRHIQALWRIGVTTADALADADPVLLYDKLREYIATRPKFAHIIAKEPRRGVEMIQEWQDKVAQLAKQQTASEAKRNVRASSTSSADSRCAPSSNAGLRARAP